MGLAELMGIEEKKGGGALERGYWAVFALLLCGCVSGALSALCRMFCAAGVVGGPPCWNGCFGRAGMSAT